MIIALIITHGDKYGLCIDEIMNEVKCVACVSILSYMKLHNE